MVIIPYLSTIIKGSFITIRWESLVPSIKQYGWLFTIINQWWLGRDLAQALSIYFTTSVVEIQLLWLLSHRSFSPHHWDHDSPYHPCYSWLVSLVIGAFAEKSPWLNTIINPSASAVAVSESQQLTITERLLNPSIHHQFTTIIHFKTMSINRS